MVFEGENKILDEDVIKRIPRFILTAFEWLSFNGILIVKDIASTQAGAQMYEVPDGRIFFLVGCSVMIANILTNSDYEVKLAVDEQQFDFAGSTSLLQISAGATGTDPLANESISSDYAIPLRFDAGFKFFAYDNPSTQGNSQAMIQGYEIPKNLSEPGF